tara:strand:+ start:145 stop:666 length:522 start_codon:yes stop_codon:yes gene_type:complete
MKIKKLPIQGSFVIEHNLYKDTRGMFGREFCDKIISKSLKLRSYKIRQTNISFNKKSGTLRGFHYQIGKSAETKIITLYKGAIYDVILDLRKNSPTFKKWHSLKIKEDKICSIIVPKGCANAFLTLKDDSIIHYITNKNYNKKLERGVRYNDARYNIKWPSKPKIISKKDMAW